MNDPDDTPAPTDLTPLCPEQTIRDRADERLRTLKDQELETLSPEEIRQTLHELHVHQIELEVQNEELRRAQEELTTARTRYFDLYDLAPVGYCTLGEKGLILEANLTAASLLGVARGALIGRPVSQLILKEDQDIFYLHRKHLVDTGTPQAIELRMVKMDHTVFWARLHATASHDSAGAPVILIVLSDITEQKLAEEALRASELRESENRFLKLFRQHSAVMLILDAETGDIIDANHAAVQFYGWPLEELKQKRIQQINTLPPEVVKTAMMNASLFKKVKFEFRHRRADGTLRDVEVFSNKIESAGKELLFSIIHDITERKQAEEILRQEERFLRTILQTTADGFFVVNVEGKITQVNEAYCRMSGYSRDELLNLAISTIDDVEDPAMAAAHIQRAIANGSEIFESRHRRKDGSVFPVEISTTYMNTGSGRFVSFCRDITERKHAEESLLRQTAELVATKVKLEDEKRLLAAVMEALPTGVAITDKMGGSIQVNAAFTRIWGGGSLPETRSVKDYARYKAWWDKTGRPVAPEEWASAIAVQKGRITVGQIMRIERFDGSEAFIINSAAPVYDTEGNIVGSAVAIQDITELKRVEQSLMESRKDFVRAQEVGNIGSWRLDIRRNMLAWSDENYRIFGIRPGTPLSYDKFLSIVHPDDRSIVDAQWKAGLGGAPYDLEHRLVVDGRIKWIREKAFLEFSQDGMLIGGFGIAQDITERKQAEEQLHALNEELERRVENRTRELQEAQSQYLHAEKLAAIGKLSASIAHEFNNPLQGIMLLLRGLKKRAILEEEDRELLESAIDESERMKNLIRSLQDFNRPSSGKKVLMDLQKSIESVLLLQKSDFRSKRISVVLHYAEHLPQIMAIPDQIKQVFLNLLTNAADACIQPGGVITISTWREEERVAVAIKDTGIGIKPEHIDLLFQPFYTTKPEVKGTGLGLSVCHGIIQGHQGEISVESQPGKGSTFTIRLPLKGE